jgi:hypothetical protein
MPCSAPIITLLEPFRCLFTEPTWKRLLTLLRGTLLARGRRTVTAALWQTGHEQDPHFSAFHQALNRARWSPLQASRHLLQLLIETFGQAGGALDIVIDETLERRWGSKIRKRGHYRDSVRSSHARSVSSPGLRWIVLAVVVRVPWTKQRWAPPFLCVLATTPEVSAKLGIRHKALFSTDQAQSAAEIIGDFMKRWSLETTFEESRAHLGIETQRQWSDRAIERTTPLLFGLYSLVTLFGSALAPDGLPPHRQSAWYRKPAATFSAILALVRRHLWGNFTFPTSRSDHNVVLLPRSTLERLAQAACY